MNILKKIIQKLIIMAALLTASSAVLWFLPGDYNHDLAALINKRALLVSKKPPRIVFIGGSNLTTLKSKKIEQMVTRSRKAARSVVNMGLWGGLDMARYLEEIRPLLEPHDTVIICPEYAPLLDPAFYSSVQRDEEAKKFFFLMSPLKRIEESIRAGDYGEIIKTIALLNQLKIKTYLHSLINRGEGHISTGGFYRYAADYNSYGDRKFPFKLMRPLRSGGIVFQKPVMENLLYLKDFTIHAQKNNIRVSIAFPPFPEPEYRRNQQRITLLYRIIRNDLKLNLLTRPEDSVYPELYFADTVYHLNEKGENLRSQMLAEKLSELIH